MFLALRELLYAKTRYIMIGFIIVLIASLIFIISGLAKGLSANNASALQDLPADYLLLEKSEETQLAKSLIPKADLEAVQAAAGVQDAAPLTIRMANTMVGDTDKSLDLALFVTDGDMLLPKAIKGKQISAPDDLIVDQSVKKEGIKVGDQLKSAGKTLTIAGFSEDERYSHTSVAYVSSKAFAGDPQLGGKVNAFAVKTDLSKEKLDSETGGVYKILTKDEALKGIPSYSEEQASLNMMIVFLLVIAAFVLAVFFYVMTLQKRSQFGVLKALGTKTGYLIRSLLGQVTMISVICIAIGAALTYGIGLLLPEGMPFATSPATMLQASVLILAMALLGSLVSMFQVAKIDPLEAIEGGEK